MGNVRKEARVRLLKVPSSVVDSAVEPRMSSLVVYLDHFKYMSIHATSATRLASPASCERMPPSDSALIADNRLGRSLTPVQQPKPLKKEKRLRTIADDGSPSAACTSLRELIKLRQHTTSLVEVTSLLATDA
ncbi:uncharacterized protein UMAG_02112 [Mycosarcoma maydis]|uniref:Uncharacterized protein n=1 Tax=Mycosarcoma maydis TaxID=5270 RepID=A0A0D1C809_MYCMD|nr:uncharacterized protein UMAG_02112 [Ustilago maydis 521]KIS69577.1 hypothetical protein UMAG_02112 [Ustilago maydis 521]|eukprot:XP_011388474.1 hypothetical protein UMAG_02112 [Ustilago maydis 521]